MEFKWMAALLCAYIQLCVYAAYTPAKETEIRQETLLSATYDVMSRPEARTNVQISLNVLAIDELDIKSQKFTTAGWLTFEWNDSRLKWNKTAKDDIAYIFAKPATVWKPEVVIDNSLADLGVVHDDYLQLKISYDGTVQWEPLKLFTTHCSVDITYYPYDQQHCTIELVSWGYEINEIDLEHTVSDINIEDYVENGEWLISKTIVSYTNLTEHTSNGITIHPQLDFHFYLDRRTDFYNLNVMMPVFLNSVLVMLVFLVPVESGEKLSYVLTVQLSLAVMLTLVNTSLPSTSVTTSILGIYLGIVLIFAGVGVFLAVIIILIYHQHGQPDMTSKVVAVARFAAKVTFSPLSKRLETTKIVPFASVGDNNEVKEDEDDKEDKTKECVATWGEVSDSINRLCFFIFMFVTILMNGLFLLILSCGSSKW